MYEGKTIALVIPARNEALTLPRVLGSVPHEVDRVLVVDNGSTDETSRVARANGAQVVNEPTAGYGRACLAALEVLEQEPPEIVAFADADGSDDLSHLPELVALIAGGKADLALARRSPVEAHALSLQQRFGNWLATRLILLVWGHGYADLGPMRAITWRALQGLGMEDRDYGWTIEMQVRALRMGLRVIEHPVPYLRRKAGRSKVSGSLSGVLRAGTKILWVIAREFVGEKSCVVGGRKPRPKTP
ncbi:MAG TPA: glycosyltransferase family 2 protein [Syntrophobacteraceae bacterium]|nr:glycosyltransferase family 2 protein [Syntrophobacteraceae bacterium]